MKLDRLDTGDSFNYVGEVLTIVDWHCYREPLYYYGERVDAAPFVIREDGSKQLMSTHLWEHCEPIHGTY